MDKPGELTGVFNTAHGEETRAKQGFDLRQMEVAVSQGQLDIDQISLQANFSRVSGVQQGKQAEMRKKTQYEHTFIVLMSQLQDYVDHLEQGFIDKYGEDYAIDFAIKYLSEEEREGLKTDKEKIDAIIEKYFENGKLKPEHADSEDAKELHEIYKWHETNEIIDKANRIGDTPEMKKELVAFRQTSSVFANTQLHENIKDITEQQKTADAVKNHNLEVKIAGAFDMLKDLS